MEGPVPVAVTPPPAPTPQKVKRGVPVWAWVLIALVGIALLALLAPFFAVASLVVLITAIVALSKNTPTWMRLRNRKVAGVVAAGSAIMLLVSGTLSTSIYPTPPRTQAAAASPSPSNSPSPVMPSATPTRTPTHEPVDDEITRALFVGEPTTLADTSVTAGKTAVAVLAALEIKGRAAKTGYERDEFGQRWLDVDRNGCDTRNDTLARDLVDPVKSGPCTVMSGMLADVFTAKNIAFQRGQDTSALVQIDHIVSLSDAWQKGAQQLSADQRATFANDPLNLQAVDGKANAQKGAGDAATWLPSNKSYRCTYVARQISVKATYGLWLTQAEHDAMARILVDCPDEPALASTFAAVPAPVEVVPVEPPVPAPFTAPVEPEPAPPQPDPAPAPPAPAPPASVFYQNCDAVRAAGAAPIYAGQPGYSRKLDRDGDGVGCET